MPRKTPKEILTETTPKPDLNTRAAILAEASEIINGDRAQTYGPPKHSFKRIAKIWNGMGLGILDPATGLHEPLDPTDVALILIGMKLSRTIGAKKHRDNWVDLAGYSGLGAELADL